MPILQIVLKNIWKLIKQNKLFDGIFDGIFDDPYLTKQKDSAVGTQKHATTCNYHAVYFKRKAEKVKSKFLNEALSLETICLQKYEITTKYDPRRCYNWIALQIYKKLEITEIFLVQFTQFSLGSVPVQVFRWPKKYPLLIQRSRPSRDSQELKTKINSGKGFFRKSTFCTFSFLYKKGIF